MSTHRSWTQPICERCWRKRERDRTPVRIATRPLEQCALCGHNTTSGIYIRVDPSLVPYRRQPHGR